MHLSSIPTLKVSHLSCQTKHFGADGEYKIVLGGQVKKLAIHYQPTGLGVELTATIDRNYAGRLEADSTYNITAFSVEPHLQRKGIGTQLIIELAKLIPGYGAISISTPKGPAMNLAQKLGFTAYREGGRTVQCSDIDRLKSLRNLDPWTTPSRGKGGRRGGWGWFG